MPIEAFSSRRDPDGRFLGQFLASWGPCRAPGTVKNGSRQDERPAPEEVSGSLGADVAQKSRRRMSGGGGRFAPAPRRPSGRPARRGRHGRPPAPPRGAAQRRVRLRGGAPGAGLAEAGPDLDPGRALGAGPGATRPRGPGGGARGAVAAGRCSWRGRAPGEGRDGIGVVGSHLARGPNTKREGEARAGQRRALDAGSGRRRAARPRTARQGRRAIRRSGGLLRSLTHAKKTHRPPGAFSGPPGHQKATRDESAGPTGKGAQTSGGPRRQKIATPDDVWGSGEPGPPLPLTPDPSYFGRYRT